MKKAKKITEDTKNKRNKTTIDKRTKTTEAQNNIPNSKNDHQWPGGKKRSFYIFSRRKIANKMINTDLVLVRVKEGGGINITLVQLNLLKFEPIQHNILEVGPPIFHR